MPLNELSGTISSASLNEFLEDVLVEIIDQAELAVESALSGIGGAWKILLPESGRCLRFSKSGFVDKTIGLTGGSIIPRKIRLLEDKLTAYTEKLWFKQNTVIDVFVHSPEDYKAELIRYGVKVETIQKIGNFPRSIQQAPDDDFVAEGLSWQKSFRFPLPSGLKPGLYAIKLTAGRDNCYNSLFVLSPDYTNHRPAKLLVLASTSTWQSYNWYGGRSRYVNYEQGGYRQFRQHKIADDSGANLKRLVNRFLPNFVPGLIRRLRAKRSVVKLADNPDWWQFKRLSIKRPIPRLSSNETDVYQEFSDHLALGEWRILAFLESNDIEYDLVSGFELDRNPEILDNYQALILSTHCEYWTEGMFEGLKHFHDSRGWIVNLSGNSIYRQIEFYDDGSQRCISLEFSKSCQDETGLIGVRFDMNGYSTCAPYQVLAPDHWVFNSTGLQKGSLIAARCLNNRKPAGKYAHVPLKYTQGGSGWETDKISKTAPKDIILLAKGLNPDGGGAEMIIREPHADRGGLFSASSITFGGSLLADDICSKMVMNVLGRALD